MGSFGRPGAFSPDDLEMIERAYEAVWAEIIAHQPFRDVSKDGERKEALGRKMFAFSCDSVADAAALRDRVLASMPELLQK